MEMEWARTDTCVEACTACGKKGNWFLYDEEAVVHKWLCDDCYERYE